jgi:hypothetical protein
LPFGSGRNNDGKPLITKGITRLEGKLNIAYLYRVIGLVMGFIEVMEFKRKMWDMLLLRMSPNKVKLQTLDLSPVRILYKKNLELCSKLAKK